MIATHEANGSGRFWLGVFVFTALSVAYHASYFFHGPTNLFDIGVLLGDTNRILQGEMFGRDFISPYGPGRYYLIAAFFSLVPPSLFTFDVLLLILHGVLVALAIAVARPWLGTPMAFAAGAILTVAHGTPHKVFLMLATVGILGMLATYARRPGFKRAILLGWVIGIAGAFRYDLAAFATLATILALGIGQAGSWRARLGGLGGVAIGGMIVGLPLMVWLGLTGGLDVWWQETMERIRLQTMTGAPPIVMEKSFGSPSLRVAAVSCLVATYAIALLMGLWFSLKRRDGSSGLLLIGTSLIGAQLLNQLFLEVKYDRFLHVLPPAIFLWLWGLKALETDRARLRIVSRTIAFALPVLFLVWTILVGRYMSQASPRNAFFSDQKLEVERGGVWMRDGMAARTVGVMREIERYTKPGEPIYCHYAAAHFYFLLDRPNITRYTDPGYYFSDDMQHVMVGWLEEHRPRVAVLKQILIAGRGLPSHQKVMFPYFASHYHQVAQYGAHIVLVRNER